MPVDRETFTRIRQHVIETAPPGLSKDEFMRLLDDALQQADRPSTPLPEAATRGMLPASSGQAEPKSWRGLARNAGRDLSGQVAGVMDIVRHPIRTLQSVDAANRAEQASANETLTRMLAGKGESPMPVSERLSRLADAAYEQPVTAALLAAPLVPPATRAVKAGASMAGSAGRAVPGIIGRAARAVPDSAVDAVAVGAGLATGDPTKALTAVLATTGRDSMSHRMMNALRGIGAAPGDAVSPTATVSAIGGMGGNDLAALYRSLQNKTVLTPMEQQILDRLEPMIRSTASNIGRSWNVGGKGP